MKTKTLLLAALLATSGMALADAGQSTTKPVAHHKGSVKETSYVRLEGGLAMPFKSKEESVKLKRKNSLMFGVGGGYIFNEFFRADLTLGYQDYKYKKDKNNNAFSGVKTYSLMANGYLEAYNDTIFRPFLLAGVGIGSSKVGLNDWSETDAATNVKTTHSYKTKRATNFIWNVGVGARAKVTDSVDVDLTYKFMKLGNAKVTITKKEGTNAPTTSSGKVKNIGSHAVLAGVMFRF